MRILVATEPVDFRKGIDGLAAICRKQLAQDPMTGCVFVFRNLYRLKEWGMTIRLVGQPPIGGTR